MRRNNATGNFRHGPHRERGIIALTRRLVKVKNAVRSETGVSKPFLAAVRAHNHSLQADSLDTTHEICSSARKVFQKQPMDFC